MSYILVLVDKLKNVLGLRHFNYLNWPHGSLENAGPAGRTPRPLGLVFVKIKLIGTL